MKHIVVPTGGVVALALVVAACGAAAPRPSGSPGGPSTAAPTSTATAVTAAGDPTTTVVRVQPAATTTVPIDTATVPAVITVAYVDAVFVQLDHIRGNVVRAILASREISPAVQFELGSIYTIPQLKLEAKLLVETFASSHPGIRSDPGDEVVRVTQLVSATRSCIFVRATTDYSAIDSSKSGPHLTWDYYLLQRKPLLPARPANTTAWLIAGSEQVAPGDIVSNQC